MKEDKIYPENLSERRVLFSSSESLPAKLEAYRDNIIKMPVELFEEYRGRKIGEIERTITYDTINNRVYISDSGFVDGEGIKTIHEGHVWKFLVGAYDLSLSDLKERFPKPSC